MAKEPWIVDGQDYLARFGTPGESLERLKARLELTDDQVVASGHFGALRGWRASDPVSERWLPIARAAWMRKNERAHNVKVDERRAERLENTHTDGMKRLHTALTDGLRAEESAGRGVQSLAERLREELVRFTDQPIKSSVVVAARDGGTDDCLLIAEGKNGQLRVFATKVVISRDGFSGFATQGLKGRKDIRLAAITSIQLKPAGTISGNGYIAFGYPGSQESKGGLFDAVKDENTIVFKGSQAGRFAEAKQLIDRLIDDYHETSGALPQAMPPGGVSDRTLHDLSLLADLRDRGVLTAEEFEAKKQEILARDRGADARSVP